MRVQGFDVSRQGLVERHRRVSTRRVKKFLQPPLAVYHGMVNVLPLQRDFIAACTPSDHRAHVVARVHGVAVPPRFGLTRSHSTIPDPQTRMLAD